MPGRILLVEDDESIRTMLEYTLSEDGYFVTTASNGLDGVQAARTNTPDVILLDVQMPGMTGFDVARELQQDPRTADLPIVFLTARATTEDMAMGLAAGATTYITKPFRLDELLAILDSFF